MNFSHTAEPFKMLRIRDQPVAVEPVGKKLFAQCDRLLLLHFVDAGFQPIFLRSLDDERGPVRIEAVRMQIEPAPFGVREIESKRIEFLFAARAR